MRILYGVVGEGMGHATRSRVVLEHLLRQGREVLRLQAERADRVPGMSVEAGAQEHQLGLDLVGGLLQQLPDDLEQRAPGGSGVSLLDLERQAPFESGHDGAIHPQRPDLGHHLPRPCLHEVGAEPAGSRNQKGVMHHGGDHPGRCRIRITADGRTLQNSESFRRSSLGIGRSARTSRASGPSRCCAR